MIPGIMAAASALQGTGGLLGQIFIAVGYDSAVTNPVINTSTDGITWNSHAADPASNWSPFAVAAAADFAIAVGSTTTAPVPTGDPIISKSANGLSWAQKTISLTGAALFFVNCDGPLCVAVGEKSDQTGAILTSSDDGETWTERTAGVSARLYGAAYHGGTYVVVGGNETTDVPVILTSSDGISWTSQTASPATNAFIFAVAHDGTRFIAVGAKTDPGFPGSFVYTDPIVMTSPDGISWTARTAAPTTNAAYLGIACANGICVVVGSTPPYTGASPAPLIATSSDHGATFTTQTADPATHGILWNVVFADSIFVAVGNTDDYADPIITAAPSPATTWTQGAPSPATGTNLVAITALPPS